MIAVNRPRQAFFLSIMRGYIILIPAIVICGHLFGINGVWASVPITEALVTVIGTYFVTTCIKGWKNYKKEGI